jgi:hypothetical protein
MMLRRVGFLSLLSLLALLPAALGPASAGPVVFKKLTVVSGPTPFKPGCEGAPQTGTLYPNAEVEPWVAVNPRDPRHIVGVWQQDRYSNGGARSLLAAVSFNGGKNWQISMAPISRCSGGNPQNGGDYERASDPWVTFAPNGDVYQIAIAFNDSNPINAVLVSKSTDGGKTWGNPATLIRDTAPTVFNDKESITADPNDARFVYAVWDRLVFPSEEARGRAPERAIGFRGPAWFARTTDGGQTWEAPRVIFDPGEVNQTISNQIVVRPQAKGGELINLFDLIYNAKNAQGVRGFNIAVIRSTDKGETWSQPIIVSKQVLFDGVRDPDTGTPVRTGDIVPDIAVDPNSGNLYVVWQDQRFSPAGAHHIAFSMSTDGGLTWTPPIRVDKTPLNVHAFTASVHVAADGTVGVSYYDFRRHTSASSILETDYWFVHCHPFTGDCTNPANWAETHIAGPFDMRGAPFAGGYFVGDYEGLASAGDVFLPFFVQVNTGNPSNRTDVFAAD